MAKLSLLLSLLTLSFSFTVLAEELNIVSSVAMPPHHHLLISPAMAPSPHHHHHAHPPAHAPTGHHHHHAHPPAHAPMVHSPPPTHAPAPVHPPKMAPPHPPKTAPTPPKVAPTPPKIAPTPPKVAPAPPKVAPTPSPPKYHFPRSFVAVQGVVFCKSCKYAGSDTLLNATAVLGATVKLQCNNTKYPQAVTSKTDKNGYFYVVAPKTVTNFGAHKCKVTLVSSPMATCQKPSALHGGATGAVLRPEKAFTANKLPFVLFTVGPLAFEPKC